MKKSMRASSRHVVLALAAALRARRGRSAAREAAAPSKITIAYQPGLGYAPLILMKQQRTIERQFPGTQVDWKVLASGTPITTGVISGDIQIGAIGVGPMLVGWARGVNWKVIAPLNEGDLWLMAKDPSIRTIADLRGKRIATPTNTSIQAVALRKMAEVKLGNAKALDSGLLAMDHPDGMQALLTGQIDAHFTSPPFQFQEKVRGAHVVGALVQLLRRAHVPRDRDDAEVLRRVPAVRARVLQQRRGAWRRSSENPDRVAQILQQDAGGTPTNRQFKQWLVNQALNWTTRPRGLMRTAYFMRRTDQISPLWGAPPSVAATPGGAGHPPESPSPPRIAPLPARAARCRARGGRSRSLRCMGEGGGPLPRKSTVFYPSLFVSRLAARRSRVARPVGQRARGRGRAPRPRGTLDHLRRARRGRRRRVVRRAPARRAARRRDLDRAHPDRVLGRDPLALRRRGRRLLRAQHDGCPGRERRTYRAHAAARVRAPPRPHARRRRRARSRTGCPSGGRARGMAELVRLGSAFEPTSAGGTGPSARSSPRTTRASRSARRATGSAGSTRPTRS